MKKAVVSPGQQKHHGYAILLSLNYHKMDGLLFAKRFEISYVWLKRCYGVAHCLLAGWIISQEGFWWKGLATVLAPIASEFYWMIHYWMDVPVITIPLLILNFWLVIQTALTPLYDKHKDELIGYKMGRAMAEYIASGGTREGLPEADRAFYDLLISSWQEANTNNE